MSRRGVQHVAVSLACPFVQWRSLPAHLRAFGECACVPRRVAEAKALFIGVASNAAMHIISEASARRVIETSRPAPSGRVECFYASSALAMR